MAPSEEQQQVMLADESGSDAPAPAPARGGLGKYVAAAGLCLMALVGVEVATRGPGAPAAPLGGRADGYLVGLAASEGQSFQHISAECGDALKILEAQEEKDGGKSHESGHDRQCKAGEMVVRLTRDLEGTVYNLSKCFPADECECTNIELELKANAKQVHDKAVVTATCEPVDGADDEDDGFAKSPECRSLLQQLEKDEEEDSEKQKESSGHGKECGENEQTVNMTKKVHGFEFLRSKCFPTECKCENIKKDLEAHAAQINAEVEVSCE